MGGELYYTFKAPAQNVRFFALLGHRNVWWVQRRGLDFVLVRRVVVLLAGAVAYARAQGAPAVEGYPVDNRGRKVDLTMAYVGTVGVFERAGFVRAGSTQSVLNGFPRVVMRLDLR